ncbi:MAG TPA: acylphosphatase [Candidatus Omnitrophota bacterium]|jgi:acylphosphatase|nr:acylphosphatase [Candidatus Omnitrophota bacterium]
MTQEQQRKHHERLVQAHIFYSGIVQGVGFRYTVRGYASRLGLQGWVRNLHDGRVEILVEGYPAGVENLMMEVEEYFSESISKRELFYGDPAGEFHNFRII